jgi:branched-chain amino acid transport system ATP-binding protein
MLRVRNLEAGYGKLRVLRGVSLHVSPGEIVIIIGANGAGKSTLLRAISGVIRPHSGEVLFGDLPIQDRSVEEIVERGCVMVPEGRQLFGTLSVRDNLILGAYLTARGGRHTAPGEQAGQGPRAAAGAPVRYTRRVRRAEVRRRLQETYDLFPVLAERQHQLGGTLSGGEQQMVAIGRALMSAPRLIMMDEPSMGLAPLVVQRIFEVIARLPRTGRTVLLVEQNARASLEIASRGYVLETGQIVISGTSQELLDNHDVQRAYLGKDYKRIEGEP